MSLSTEDLIHLPYDDSLTLAGATYTCRSLHHPPNLLRRVSPHHLRRTVVSIASELAMRRWLETEGVTYGLIRDRPLTHPERYKISIGGRRLIVRTTFISAQRHLRRLHREHSWLLLLEALIPKDHLESSAVTPGDPYVFIFITGFETRSRNDLQRAVAASRPTYLIAIPPERIWRQPRPPRPLGKLVLKSANPQPVDIELGGQLADLTFHSQHITLPPHQRIEAPTELAALHFIHPTRPPTGALAAHCPALQRTWVIGSNNWDNIWIYGQEVILVGWITKAMVKQQAQLMLAGNRTQLGWRTQRDYRYLPISRLRSMHELVDRILLSLKPPPSHSC